MPKVLLIRQSFINKTQLSGEFKITHFNARHVYIDLDDVLDIVTVWTKQRIVIECQPMRIQTWAPTFKPIEENTDSSSLDRPPELPWHCYYKDLLNSILSLIGNVLYLDNATVNNKRGNMESV